MPLYAVYHEPATPRPGAPVVVHCHSLGVEQLTLYRCEVLAARAAAEAGFPVFRYHSRGHGDSAGDFAAASIEGLVEDALGAVDHALGRSRAPGVAWLGVRFGALVAGEAARCRKDAAGIALWEPVHRPEEYFRGLLRGLLFSKVAKGERPDATADELYERVMREGRLDVHGYFLHRRLVESAAGLDLARVLEGWAGPTLLAQIQARGRLAPQHAALAAALERRGAKVTVLRIAEEPGWHFISNPAWEFPELVRGTAEWLDALA